MCLYEQLGWFIDLWLAGWSRQHSLDEFLTSTMMNLWISLFLFLLSSCVRHFLPQAVLNSTLCTRAVEEPSLYVGVMRLSELNVETRKPKLFSSTWGAERKSNMKIHQRNEVLLKIGKVQERVRAPFKTDERGNLDYRLVPLNLGYALIFGERESSAG